MSLLQNLERKKTTNNAKAGKLVCQLSGYLSCCICQLGLWCFRMVLVGFIHSYSGIWWLEFVRCFVSSAAVKLIWWTRKVSYSETARFHSSKEHPVAWFHKIQELSSRMQRLWHVGKWRYRAETLCLKCHSLRWMAKWCIHWSGTWLASIPSGRSWRWPWAPQM